RTLPAACSRRCGATRQAGSPRSSATSWPITRAWSSSALAWGGSESSRCWPGSSYRGSAGRHPSLPSRASRTEGGPAMGKAKESAPYGRKTQRELAVKEVHVLWTPDGLGCDGDTVSTTAATQPSIEDILMGAIPGLPKVHLHNRVLAYSQGGDEYMKGWFDAAEGRLEGPFSPVVEGASPNERSKAEGYWAAMGNDPSTGQPITLCDWIDRLAPRALAVVGAGTCATYGGIHAMAGNPTGCMGLADYLGWDWRSHAGIPIVNVPVCPVQ